jgi:hypothetical protein
LTVSVDNIIIGAGDLFIAGPTDGWYNTFETDSRATLMTNGSHVGATIDGVEIQYEPDYTDVSIDQLKDAALIYHNGYRVTVRTNLAEATLKNLMIAWSLPTSAYVSSTTLKLSLPVPADEPTERRLVVFGRSPASTASVTKLRKYFCRRAVAVDTSSHALKRGEATIFPVAFRILGQPTYSNAEYGFIEDEI